MKKEFLDFVREVERRGYRRERSKGSHFVYVNPNSGHSVSINKDLNKMVAKRLLKEIENHE